MTKLNIGCGTDYRPDFVNIDGSTTLPKVDKIIDLSTESLLAHFPQESIDYILANDIIEHHFHWEATRLLTEFYALLKPNAEAEIRVPDAGKIIRSWRMPLERKLTLLFGGQDIPQDRKSAMNDSRKTFPEYFCHKYGWSKERMISELKGIGFSSVSCHSAGTNFIAIARK